jgi:hypothetical protein
MSDEAWNLVVSMTHSDPSKQIPLVQVIDKLHVFKETGLQVPSVTVFDSIQAS